MANYTRSDMKLLDSSLSKLLQEAGVSENSFPTLATDLMGNTNGDLTLYVETTGNDNNHGTITAPCSSINGALARLPTGKNINHMINIKMGIGNFPGFNIEGFTIDSATIGALSGISILGTLVNATLGAGTATGTITSVVAGNAATPSFCVVNDTLQAWTVDALKGLLLEILTGTNAGLILPIISNTATSITVAQAAAFGATSGTYAIRDWGTVINSATTIETAMPVAQGAPGTPLSYGVAIRNNNSPSNTAYVQLESIKLNSSASSSELLISGDRAVTILHCYIGGAVVGLTSSGTGLVSVRQSVFKGNSSSVTINIGNGGIFSALSNLITSVSGSLNTAISLSGGGHTAGFTQIVIDSTTNGVTCSNPGQRTSLSGCKITAVTTCVRMSNSSFVYSGGSHMEATGLELTGATNAIIISGLNTINITTLKCSSCTNGVVASYGAHVQLGSAGTMTTVTNELTVDGAISTIASMRGATPKLLSSVYFTIVHE